MDRRDSHATFRLSGNSVSFHARSDVPVASCQSVRPSSFATHSARDAESLSALVRPLPHYGRKSYVVFDGAKAIESGVWPARPQVWKLTR